MSKITESSLFQLTLVRFREFLREPEAIFWVFLFPILLAGGLGLAFKNRPPEVLKIGAATEQLIAALSADKGLNAALMNEAAGTQALRNGRIVLYVSGAGSASSMKFDDTNPEARTARLLADRALQRAAGAKDAVQVKDEMVREPGSRYIDFVVPGLLGMNLMGSGIWGLGFTIVDARRRKLLKRLVASPMPRWQYLMSFLFSRLIMLVFEVAALVGSAALVFGVPLRGGIGQLAILCLLSALSFSCL
ncbi:MAG: ABC transporter permease, partial [Bryobacteraceae bacterium]